jgi:hypothetical protein
MCFVIMGFLSTNNMSLGLSKKWRSFEWHYNFQWDTQRYKLLDLRVVVFFADKPNYGSGDLPVYSSGNWICKAKIDVYKSIRLVWVNTIKHYPTLSLDQQSEGALTDSWDYFFIILNKFDISSRNDAERFWILWFFWSFGSRIAVFYPFGTDMTSPSPSTSEVS